MPYFFGGQEIPYGQKIDPVTMAAGYPDPA
jgi:hypothetical protein